MSSRLLGICCALTAELRTLTRNGIAPGELAYLDQNTVITLTGIGREQARRGASRLIAEGAGALLSWGSAAALDEDLKPGDIVLPRTISSVDGKIFTANKDWHQRLSQHFGKKFEVHTGALAETYAVLTDIAQKRSLAASQGAIAADMETAAIAEICQRTGILWIAVRAISDTVTMRVPQRLVKAVNEVGVMPLPHIVTEVILHPQDWLTVIRLARGMHSAQTSLKQLFRFTGNLELR
ncbi:MAG: hypothetical protein GY807_05640 [Gammaproteobacteria bacterium]|nr:hypothetical protein [Gammaproteobacteria bacterium]